MDENTYMRNGVRVSRSGGSTVVSARLDAELVHELDQLAARTGRSRGFYLRAAIQEMLPVLKEKYWEHDVTSRQHEVNKLNAFLDTITPPKQEE